MTFTCILPPNLTAGAPQHTVFALKSGSENDEVKPPFLFEKNKGQQSENTKRTYSNLYLKSFQARCPSKIHSLHHISTQFILDLFVLFSLLLFSCSSNFDLPEKL